jgi:methylmalonyl-CoA mutase
LLREWPTRLKSITDEVTATTRSATSIRVENYRESLSHQKIPKIAAPTYKSWGELLMFLQKENLPGYYPYTGGVYPYRRTGEDPIRMFAGEGTPERTNRRFHYLSLGQPAQRLSTAFDSVTLYGEDPAERPDIYGKIGNSGVSIATLDDMKKLYSGFDLCAPATSVSMTINGPAPMILAMFMNTAIDQQVEKYLQADPDRWNAAHATIEKLFEGKKRPEYSGMLPEGNNGLGLALLGVTGDQVVDADTYARIRPTRSSRCAAPCRPTSSRKTRPRTPASSAPSSLLRMMGDIQQFFVDKGVRNFYSVSISGTTSPKPARTRSASWLSRSATGFTIVEYYLARGMKIDDFAPNLSFFFSNGMGPRVHRDRPRRAPHLGAGDARALRRQRALADAQVPHPDVRPVAARAGDPVQRHPHHAAGRCTRCSTTATRCTPTPTTRRSPRRPRRACAARWRSR